MLPSLIVTFDSYISNRAFRKSIIDPYAEDKEDLENDKDEEWEKELEHEINKDNLAEVKV